MNQLFTVAYLYNGSRYNTVVEAVDFESGMRAFIRDNPEVCFLAIFDENSTCGCGSDSCPHMSSRGFCNQNVCPYVNNEVARDA